MHHVELLADKVFLAAMLLMGAICVFIPYAISRIWHCTTHGHDVLARPGTQAVTRRLERRVRLGHGIAT